jgi:hypothetical protein
VSPNQPDINTRIRYLVKSRREIAVGNGFTFPGTNLKLNPTRILALSQVDIPMNLVRTQVSARLIKVFKLNRRKNGRGSSQRGFRLGSCCIGRFGPMENIISIKLGDRGFTPVVNNLYLRDMKGIRLFLEELMQMDSEDPHSARTL